MFPFVCSFLLVAVMTHGFRIQNPNKPASGSQRSACCLDRLDLWTAGPGPDWHVGNLNDTHGIPKRNFVGITGLGLIGLLTI
jgi:hypothetical protein